MGLVMGAIVVIMRIRAFLEVFQHDVCSVFSHVFFFVSNYRDAKIRVAYSVLWGFYEVVIKIKILEHNSRTHERRKLICETGKHGVDLNCSPEQNLHKMWRGRCSATAMVRNVKSANELCNSHESHPPMFAL